MAPGIEAFPPATQVLLTMLGFVFAVAVWAYGYLKKPGTKVSNDVVVPNVNVMDSYAIRDAAKALRENMVANEERERIVRDLFACVRTQTELQQAMVRLVKENNELLESIDERMKNEYYASRQEREREGRARQS